MAQNHRTRVYLLRHGEIETYDRRVFNGKRDVPLTPRGIQQLEEIAKRLSSEGIRSVYTSTLQRSMRGGEAIARASSVPCVHLDGLCEKNYGAWEGLTATEVEMRYPTQWAEYRSHPEQSRPEGGESHKDVLARVLETLHAILGKHAGETIAIVAHGGVNKLVLGEALGAPLVAFPRIEQKYAALNVIDYYEEGAIVRLMNG